MLRGTGRPYLLIWLVMAQANAWEIHEPNPYVWTESPVEILVHNTSPDGVTQEQFEAAVDRAIAGWNAAACDGFPELVNAGTHDDALTGFDNQDNTNSIIVGDPAHELDGVPAASLTFRFGNVEVHDGTILAGAVDSDTVLNNVPFDTHDNIISGACVDGYDLDHVLTHQLGHLLGLGHSEDPDAVMFLSPGPCEAGPVEPSPDDVDGIGWLYGSAALRASCSPPVGGTPLSTVCYLTSRLDPADLSVSWDFGDGGTGSGPTVDHVFEGEGRFEVEVCADRLDDSDCEPRWCGTVDVNVCGEPEASGHAEPTIDPLVFRLVNDTDLASGCYQYSHWTVTSANGDIVLDSTWWEPDLAVEALGTYRVFLTVEGIAGDANVEFTVDVVAPVEEEKGGCGCAHGSPSAALWLLAIAAIRRRSQSWTMHSVAVDP